MCLGVLLVLLPAAARADMGVMIADPTTVGASAFTHAGHALVYLTGVCADTPVRARLCRTGENGSVVTRYPKFHESSSYGWNIVPIELYLEGSMRPGERLLYGSQNVRDALASKARDGFMKDVCSGACPIVAHSYWRDMVAATITRDIFVFAVKTDTTQDEKTVEWLNAQENVDRYNGVTNNCATFVKDLINVIFPHSVHRDVINDIGMMTPKAAAHSFTSWAQRQRDLGFYIMHFSQKPGSIARSGVASSGTETAIHMKKYLIAAAMIGDHEVAGSFFVAYWLTGRFGLYKEYVRHSTPRLTELERTHQAQKETGGPAELRLIEAEIETNETQTTGTDAEWTSYRQRFTAMREAAAPSDDAWKTVLKRLDRGTISVDGNGDTWAVPEKDTRRVGISNRIVLAEGSDPQLALQLMAWRVGFALSAKKRMRPGIVEFREDWALFERAYAQMHPTVMIAGADEDGKAATSYAAGAAER